MIPEQEIEKNGNLGANIQVSEAMEIDFFRWYDKQWSQNFDLDNTWVAVKTRYLIAI